MIFFRKNEKQTILELKKTIAKYEEKQVISQQIIESQNNKLKQIINNHSMEIEKLSKPQKTSTFPYERQFEKMVSSFDILRVKNIELENNNKKLVEENKLLKPSISIDKISNAKYKILIKDLYLSQKYSNFKKICEDANIMYVHDLNSLNFEDLIKKGYSQIKINNAKNEYVKFKNNEFSPNIYKYLTSGHEISKVFFRHRSFIFYLTSIGIKYMCELDKFKFETLKEQNFTSIQINKLQKKFTEYNNLRKI